jgi:GT2 family glycosyltransferase
MEDFQYDIAIIFPIYNPPKNWETYISTCIDEIEKTHPDKKVIFILVNDGSNQAFVTKVFSKESKNYLYINHSFNIGKGAAIRSGVNAVISKYYVYTDWDIPFGIGSITAVMQKLFDKKGDVILAVRSKEYYSMLPLTRRVISNFVLRINYIIFRGKFKDSQAGLKGYSWSAAEYLKKGKVNGFLFEIEFLLSIRRTELKCVEIYVEPKKGLILNDVSIKLFLNNVFDYVGIIAREFRKNHQSENKD